VQPPATPVFYSAGFSYYKSGKDDAKTTPFRLEGTSLTPKKGGSGAV
jgi:hypothetical protein